MSQTAAVPTRRPRVPRFRAVEPRHDIALTERDITILGLLAHHRFLRAPAIARRIAPAAEPCPNCHGTGRVMRADGRQAHHTLCLGTGRRGHKVIIQRIGALYANGYLTRPQAQLDYWLPGGSQRLVYALASDGARALMSHGQFKWSERVEHSIRNATASKRFIHHTLAVADLSLALHDAKYRQPDVTLLETHALIATLPAKTQARELPFKLRANLSLGSTQQPFAVVPDWAFLLEFAHPRTRRRERRGFLAEIDMGTMPIARASAAGTSLIKKMLVYQTAAEAGQHSRDFEWQNFRVPIITTTLKRIEAIRREMAKSPLLAKSEYFYFTTFDALRACDNLLAMPWIKPNGHLTTLLPAAT